MLCCDQTCNPTIVTIEWKWNWTMDTTSEDQLEALVNRHHSTLKFLDPTLSPHRGLGFDFLPSVSTMVTKSIVGKRSGFKIANRIVSVANRQRLIERWDRKKPEWARQVKTLGDPLILAAYCHTLKNMCDSLKDYTEGLNADDPLIVKAISENLVRERPTPLKLKKIMNDLRKKKIKLMEVTVEWLEGILYQLRASNELPLQRSQKYNRKGAIKTLTSRVRAIGRGIAGKGFSSGPPIETTRHEYWPRVLEPKAPPRKKRSVPSPPTAGATVRLPSTRAEVGFPTGTGAETPLTRPSSPTLKRSSPKSLPRSIQGFDPFSDSQRKTRPLPPPPSTGRPSPPSPRLAPPQLPPPKLPPRRPASPSRPTSTSGPVVPSRPRAPSPALLRETVRPAAQQPAATVPTGLEMESFEPPEYEQLDLTNWAQDEASMVAFDPLVVTWFEKSSATVSKMPVRDYQFVPSYDEFFRTACDWNFTGEKMIVSFNDHKTLSNYWKDNAPDLYKDYKKMLSEDKKLYLCQLHRMMDTIRKDVLCIRLHGGNFSRFARLQQQGYTLCRDPEYVELMLIAEFNMIGEIAKMWTEKTISQKRK